MHAANEVSHLVQRLLAWLDHQVDTLAEDVELGVGDQRGHLDEFVALQVEAGHLAVHPDEQLVHPDHSTVLQPRPAPPAAPATVGWAGHTAVRVAPATPRPPRPGRPSPLPPPSGTRLP